MFRLLFRLPGLRAFACLCVAAGLGLPALAQSSPLVFNTVLATGIDAVGIIEGSDGNYYARSPRAFETCQSDATKVCAYIYQISSTGAKPFHAFEPTADTTATPANADGVQPTSLFTGTDGNLYGSCMTGGPGGFGTIYKIEMTGQFTLLASFGITNNAQDPGSNPTAMTQGADGLLYFTNGYGVYSMPAAGGAITTLFTFTFDPKDFSPVNGNLATSIMQASDGNFYLTLNDQPGLQSFGTPTGAILQMTPAGAINVVHVFASDGSEGNMPSGPLVQGPDGFLYGVTRYSANTPNTVSMAFKIQPGGGFAALGPLPASNLGRIADALILGSDGNFYGTTLTGGDTTSATCTTTGCGTVFQMTPAGTFQNLHSFEGGIPTDPSKPAASQVDGAGPESPLVLDHRGDLIGSSIGGPHSVPAFFDIDWSGTLKGPITLTVEPAVAAVNTPVKITWTASNAFSLTAQQCGAAVQGGLTGAGNWSGPQTGALANGLYTGTATVTPTKEGTYTYALVCGGNEAGFAQIEVSSGLQITSLALPSGEVNVPYKTALTAIGGTPPYTWSIANMPEGLALESATGIIAGTPRQFGDYSLAVTLTDSATPPTQVTATVTLKITSNLEIQTTSLLKATVDAGYSQRIRAQFGLPPYKWTITAGTLPDKLQLQSGTPDALLTGIPTASGNYTITVQVEDSETTPATKTITYVLKIVPNVEVASVEFTQAIQQFQTLDDLQSSLSGSGEPPVPVVAGKWAAMRVYFTQLKTATTVTLKATGAVTGVKTVRLAPNCPAESQRIRTTFCKSMDFYFVPPEGAWTTVLTLTDDKDNQLEQETLDVKSRTTYAVNYKGVSICSVPGQASSCQSPSALLSLTWFASRILPTASITTNVTRRTIYRARSNYPTALKWEDAVTDDVQALYTLGDSLVDANTKQRTDYAGVYSGTIDSTGVGVLSGHGLIIPNSAQRQGVDGTAQVLAHETGHTLSLTHTGIGTPHGNTLGSCWGSGQTNPPESMNWIFISNLLQSLNGNVEYGFDVAQQAVIGGNGTFDVMAYCMPRWISPFNYKNMFPLLSGGTVTSANAVPVAAPEIQPQPKPTAAFTTGSFMQISGSVPTTGLVLNPIFTETAVGTTDPGSGTWSIQVQDAGGQVLYTRYFTPIIAETDSMGDELRGDPHFNEFIPVTEGMASVSIHDATGNALTSVAVNGPAPTVAITSPAAGFIGSGQQTVSWTSTSPNATSFSSRIFYSADNGTTWEDVLDRADSGAVLDFDTFPGSAAGLVRVDVSDGANTGTATSLAFSVPKKKPSAVVINSPVSGAILPAANPIYLHGAASDAEDGALSGAALSWSDSVQGNLGTGSPLIANLQPGAHTVTLTATDNDGNSVTASTQVTLGGDPPAVTLTTSNASIGCYSATINATPGANGADLTSVSYSLDGGANYTPIPIASLPYTFPINASGSIVLVAAAEDGSGQANSDSAALDLGAGCTATTLSAKSGGGQSALIGGTFATALSTLVVDQGGNPVSGATVTYSAPASGPSATLSAPSAVTDSSGVAVVTATANSTAGTYNITATTSTGAAAAVFALTNTDFQIAAASQSLTVARGSAGTTNITLTAISGFSGKVSFGCFGLPTGVSCAFSPNSVTPTAPSTTITMTVFASRAASARSMERGAETVVLCVALLWCVRRRRSLRWFSLVLASTSISMALAGCGSSSHRSLPVSSTVTVTATAGSAQRTATLTVQIQ